MYAYMYVFNVYVSFVCIHSRYAVKHQRPEKYTGSSGARTAVVLSHLRSVLGTEIRSSSRRQAL